jgi:hypothetical protein
LTARPDNNTALFTNAEVGVSETAATLLLREAAIREAGVGGSTRDYFKKEWSWERPMRVQFLELRRVFDSGSQFELGPVERTLGELNRRYKTRFALRNLPVLAHTLVTALQGEPWCAARRRPELVQEADEGRDHVRLVHRVLAGCCEIARPYSLVTKFLHFLFPAGFPIFDAQAAASIQMWGYFAFEPGEGPGFAASTLANTDGSGYERIAEFYRRVLHEEAVGERRELSAAARDLEAMVGVGETDSGEYIGPIDVVDKLLWRASGNPIVLGLARRPCVPRPTIR